MPLDTTQLVLIEASLEALNQYLNTVESETLEVCLQKRDAVPIRVRVRVGCRVRIRIRVRIRVRIRIRVTIRIRIGIRIRVRIRISQKRDAVPTPS